MPPASPGVDDGGPSRKRDRDEDAAGAGLGRERRKRKRTGEDDTDFELRLARERTGTAQTTGDALVKSRSNAPLVDHAGHIDLFPGERTVAHSQKNEEAEKEAAKKKREYEDQYMMRFSNAAGRDGLVGPWYAKGGGMKDMVDGSLEPPSKDVWGNEDPRRKERDAARVVSNDPLAMMKRGAAKVREVEKERRQLNVERERELKQLRKEEKRQEKRRRREGREDHDDLEGFSLDGAPSNHAPSGSRNDDDRQRRRHHRSRDESERSRRGSEHKESQREGSHGNHRSHDRNRDQDRDRDRDRDQKGDRGKDGDRDREISKGVSKHDRRRLGKADN